MSDFAELVREYEERYAKAEIEECLRRLKEIASEMESDDIPLSRALSLYSEGVVIIRRAKRILDDARFTIEELKKFEEDYRTEKIDIDMKRN